LDFAVRLDTRHHLRPVDRLRPALARNGLNYDDT
jgi:hypothetical protein